MPATSNPNRPLTIALALDDRPRYAIAATAGMPANTFSMIATGHIEPTDDQKQRIADALNLTVENLFGGDELELVRLLSRRRGDLGPTVTDPAGIARIASIVHGDNDGARSATNDNNGLTTSD